MGLRFRSRARALDARWIVSEVRAGRAVLEAVLRRPAGAFGLSLPRTVIEADLALEAHESSMMMIQGVEWTIPRVTAHALRIARGRLSARLTLELLAPDGSCERAELTVTDEPLTSLAPPPPPRAHRRETFDLSQGIGRLRWTDDRAAVEACVSTSMWLTRRPGPRLHVPAFLGPREGLRFSACVTFGKAGVRRVTLSPLEVAPSRVPELLRWLCGRLRLKRTRPREVEWTRDGVRIRVAPEETLGIEVTLEREG